MIPGMWTYHADLLDARVPRYTSFPTAAEFGDLDESDHIEALKGADGEVSLYIHIPFCEQICWYCGCNTGRTNRIERLESYLEALHREIALVSAHVPRTARVRRIAFGGGSPNAISPVDFVRLNISLSEFFMLDDPVISIELDPRSLGSIWRDTLQRVGVQRASLGVQTFDAMLQRAIGRVQSANLIDDCTRLLRDAGVTSLNYDLMYGLPGQSLEMVEESLHRALVNVPDRIALFGYAHVPQHMPRQRQIDASALPDNASRFSMAAQSHTVLSSTGYVPIGFDHFALPHDPLAQAAEAGRLHRNFQGFTDDDAPVLIGLGASAISGFPGLLSQNHRNTGQYRAMLSQGRLPITRGLRRTGEDRERGKIVEDLLCAGSTRLPPKLLNASRLRLEPFARSGLLRIKGDRIDVTDDGVPYARTIASIFDHHRKPMETGFSTAI